MTATWDQDEFRACAENYLSLLENVGLDHFRDSQTRSFLVDAITSMAQVICHREFDLARQIKAETSKQVLFGQYYIEACILSFGLRRDLNIVRYMVEVEGNTRDRILHWDLMGVNGKSALEIAATSGQTETVYYLLEEWINTPPLQISRRRSYPTTFDSKSYFDLVFQKLPPNFSHLSKYDQCVWYFFARYLADPRHQLTAEEELQLMEERSQHLPQWKSSLTLQIAMKRLNSDSDFLLSHERCRGNPYFCHSSFRELYGHEPDLFMAILDSAESVSLHHFFMSTSILRTRSPVRQIMESWLNSTYIHPKLFTTARLLTSMQDGWHVFRAKWKALGGTALTRGPSWEQVSYPFLIGLRVVANESYQRTLQEESERAVKFVSRLSSEYVAHVNNTTRSQDGQGLIYLLASAGSGKTQHMYDTLQKNFGFYFVSGAVKSQEALITPITDGMQLYRPRLRGASKDMALLFSIFLDSRQNSSQSDYNQQLNYEFGCTYLIDNRLTMYHKVKEEFQKSNLPFDPWHWLSFQLSFENNPDCFRSLLHIRLLCDGRITGIRADEATPRQYEDQFTWCFDEVQCEISKGCHFGNSGSNTFSALVCRIIQLGGRQRSIFAGTALHLREIQKGMQRGIEDGLETMFLHPPGRPMGHRQPEIKSAGRLRLIDSDECFQALLGSRIEATVRLLWDAEDVSSVRHKLAPCLAGNEAVFEDPMFLQMFRDHQASGIFVGATMDTVIQETTAYFRKIGCVTRCSLALRGRYRWSVCYIEELFRTLCCKTFADKASLQILGSSNRLSEKLSELEALSGEDIHNASKNIQTIAKAPLKERIRLLVDSQEPEKNGLAENVFQMALQADLFGRSRILESAEAAELVEQALGYIEDVGGNNGELLQVSLAERLVVDAVLEYLRDSDRLTDLADSYIKGCQYNASVFGFSAEEHLAYSVFANALPQQTIPPRQNFLSAFDNVYKISTSSIEMNKHLALENYTLDHNPGTVATELSRNKDVSDWLKQVREGLPRATFLLPSTSAGPDVMFVLRTGTGEHVKRLVCAVQLKTGLKTDLNDKTLPVHTVDPDRWYKEAANKRKKCVLELAKCQDLEFLSVLFLAGDHKERVDRDDIVHNLSKRKRDGHVALELLKRAESELKQAKDKVDCPTTPETKKQKWEETRQEREAEVNTLKDAKSVDYYLKILDEDSVEAVFGVVFNRILRGMKGKSVDGKAPSNAAGSADLDTELYEA